LGKRGPAKGTHKTSYPVHGVRDAIAQGRIKPRPGICERCNQQHLRCSGHNHPRDSEGNNLPIGPCGKWPMHGQSVCSTHGGKGRNRVVASRQWEKERKLAGEMVRVERAVKTLGLPILTSPQQALLDEIARTAGHVQWLGNVVGNLDPDESTWGRTSEEHKEGTDVGITEAGSAIDITTTTKMARPAVWIQLYQQERAHLVHVAKVAIQCGVQERAIKLAEEQGQLIAAVLRSVFEDPSLELTEIQIGAARVVASRTLRTLSTKPALSVLKS
jgi:hypothetical protein